MQSHGMSHHIMRYHAIACHIWQYCAISCYINIMGIIRYHAIEAISCRIMPMSCIIIPYRAKSCDIMQYLLMLGRDFGSLASSKIYIRCFSHYIDPSGLRTGRIRTIFPSAQICEPGDPWFPIEFVLARSFWEISDASSFVL